MKICPAFWIQSVKWICHISISIQQETKKQRTKDKGQNDGNEKWTGLTLAVGWEDSEFIPEGFILKLLLAGETFNSFLLDGISKHFFLLFFVFSEPQLIGENCPGKRIQSVDRTYQIGLSLQDKKKDKITAIRKGKALLWLLAGYKLTSFLKDWFSNCYWLGRH